MKYVTVSDVHFGHRKTPTEHIIKSFISTVLTEENKDADVIFINGDLFDRLLDLNSNEVHPIISFSNVLLDYCYVNNILLRLLEGTPSHDWRQSGIIYRLNEIRKKKVDLKYIVSLDIEYIERIGKYVLYIPDEWCHSHDDLEEQIKEKLSLNNITKVDMAMLHGQFYYQVAVPNYKGFCFKENYFLKLVKGFIHIGHYHSFSKLDRIIANGSLERLTHGEEEDKGIVVVTDDNYKFVTNKNSFIYKTINVTQATTLASLDKNVFKYPAGSHIRLSMAKDHPYNTTFQDIKLRYMDYHVKKKVKSKDTEEDSQAYIVSDSEIDFSDRYVLDGDIHSVLRTNLLAKNTFTPIELVKLDAYLEPFKLLLQPIQET